ncbi:DEAD/DEAH box helicase [Peptoniphilus asaccharolyticus]
MRGLQLHDYQNFCVDKILEQNNVGLFLDMGLGKTLITLTSIQELMYARFLIDKVLVIAPKKVAEATWQNEIKKWPEFKNLRFSTILGNQKQRIKAIHTPADVYIINRDNIVWLVEYFKNKWPYEMVVADEFTSFKNHESKRFKALASVKPHIKRFLGLTGTPSPNGLLDLWAQVYLLDEGERLGRSFYAYRNNFFDGDYMGYNYTAKEDTNSEVTERISDICISMKADDYLTLPDVVENIIPVVLDSKAQKQYDTLERQAVLEIENADDIDATSAAALSNKLLQLANGAVYDENHKWYEIHNAKIEMFLETLEQLNGKSALVFYNFQHDRDRILKTLEKTKRKVRVLKTPQDQEDWNSGKVDVLLTHPASSAYGLNLQQGGNHVIWFGLNWNYELYAQANKRLHRQGQKEKVIIHHLVTQGTRDDDVMEALKRKENVQDYVLRSLKARISKYKSELKK